MVGTPLQRVSFSNTSTRPWPAPSPSPSTAGGETTPHCGEISAELRTLDEPNTQSSAVAGTWTSATTVVTECDSSITTPSLPEDPPASKSPTSAQAVDERRIRLGSGHTSSEPGADPEPWAPQAGRTDARHRTAAASATGGMGLHTAGGFAATPSTSTAEIQGEGAAAGDVEDADDEDVQRAPGRSSGAAETSTGARRPSEGKTTPGEGATTAGSAQGDTEGATVDNGMATSPPTES
ncbi:uncharacterized protein [Procambarus clarkii]|uniref:uncharacterized protein n=1 Tax=Procambarus clarkii TaxID=6728 RepID=UPI00374372ED